MPSNRIVAVKSPRWLVPLGIIIFCILAIVVSTTFERMPPILKRGIQPADFPQIVASLIIVLTLLSLWREPIKISAKLNLKTWGTIGLIPVFLVLAPVDFFLALGTFAIGLAALWGERRLPLLLLVGLLVPAAVFFLFDMIFEIRFPRGILTGLWYG
jgi:hypothetical protein